MKDKFINLLLEGKGKKRKKRKTRTPEHQASIDAKNVQAMRAKAAEAKFNKTVAGQSQARLHQSGNTHIDVTHGAVSDAINRASKTWRGHPDHDKEVDKAAVGASTEQGGGDLTVTQAKKQSFRRHRGSDPTAGATKAWAAAKKPDQPRGTPRHEEDVDEAQTPLNPRTPLDPIIQAFKKRQKARLQRATHGDAPPIFPDPMDAEMNEAAKVKPWEIRTKREELFPTLREIPALTKGLSRAQLAIWNKAMNKPSKARGEWRPPSTARKLATRLADSILYEEEERREQRRRFSPGLIKSPRFAHRTAQPLKTVKKHGSLTGSDSYRPTSSHATLVKNQPWRMAEKLRGLLAMWRKQGGGVRQVVKNIPVAPKFGTQRIKKLNAPKKETDLKHNRK